MRSTKIIPLWSVEHFIIVFMPLFEALGTQLYSSSWGPKSTALSSWKEVS